MSAWHETRIIGTILLRIHVFLQVFTASTVFHHLTSLFHSGKLQVLYATTYLTHESESAVVFVKNEKLVQFVMGILYEPLVMRHWSRRLSELRVIDLGNCVLGLHAGLVTHRRHLSLARIVTFAGHDRRSRLKSSGSHSRDTRSRGLIGHAMRLCWE